jgi:hypothetical protein
MPSWAESGLENERLGVLRGSRDELSRRRLSKAGAGLKNAVAPNRLTLATTCAGASMERTILVHLEPPGGRANHNIVVLIFVFV